MSKLSFCTVIRIYLIMRIYPDKKKTFLQDLKKKIYQSNDQIKNDEENKSSTAFFSSKEEK